MRQIMEHKFKIVGISENPDNSTTVAMQCGEKQFGQGLTNLATFTLNFINPALRPDFKLGSTFVLRAVKG